MLTLLHEGHSWASEQVLGKCRLQQGTFLASCGCEFWVPHPASEQKACLEAVTLLHRSPCGHLWNCVSRRAGKLWARAGWARAG